jgi:hypothetical protein
MIRQASQRDDFDALGVPTVLGDLEYPIDHAVRGCEAVIFAAGSGSKTGKDKTVLVDHIGAIRAAVAALECDARRFVMLSALNAAVDAQTAITHYHRAKGCADRFIREMPEVMGGRGLDWTIVCPGRLHDDAHGECVEITGTLQCKATTSRESVAAALVACLDLPNTIGKDIGLADGDIPLAEALRAL